MSIPRRGMLCSLVLVVAWFMPSLASAQSASTNTNDWSAISGVPTDSNLEVKLKDGKTVKGKLSGVTDTVLSLTVKDKPIEIRREEVSSVHQSSAKSATKATLIGLGVGAGAGAAIGLAGSSSNDSFDKLDRAVTAGLTVVGAGVGALTGYLIGRGGRKRVLIYLAQ